MSSSTRFLSRGTCEFLDEFARPFSGLVIADLLGLPQEDHEEFRAHFSGKVVGGIEDDALTRAHNPLEYLNEKFTTYITERRREPRSDVLTELAQAKYPDGSTPEVIDVVRLAAFLFAAGQETTTKLLSFGMRVIAENPDIQALLRDDRSRIPTFVEETLRTESPVKCHFRMARTSTSIGDTEVPAGTTVMLLPGASNRDARKFDGPNEFRIDRPNVREHVAFGRGNHSCPGAPLARRRDVFRSTASLTGCRTSPFSRRSTGHLKPAATPTSRPGRCAASPSCTSALPPSREHP